MSDNKALVVIIISVLIFTTLSFLTIVTVSFFVHPSSPTPTAAIASRIASAKGYTASHTIEQGVLGASVLHISRDVQLDGTALINGNVNLQEGTHLHIGQLDVGQLLTELFQEKNPPVASAASQTVVETGVQSLQDQTGVLNLTAGSGLEIQALTVTNTDKGSSQHIFGSISDGTTIITAGNNADKVTFKAGSGMQITADQQTHTLTIAQISTATTPASLTFSLLSTGTNTGNTLTVGKNSILAAQDNGIIDATQLQGNTWATPSAIGATTPNSGRFSSLSDTGTLSLPGLSPGIAHIQANRSVSSSAVNLASLDVSGLLPIANGGTNATTAAQARDNLGLTANGAGDIWVKRTGDTMTGNLVFNDTNPSITTSSNENLSLVPNGTGYTIVGNPGNASHSVNSNNDLLVSGQLESQGISYFDSFINAATSIFNTAQTAFSFVGYPNNSGISYGIRQKLVGSATAYLYQTGSIETWFSGSGTLSNAISQRDFVTNNGSGIISDARSIDSSISVASGKTGTITNASDLHAQTITKGSGTIGTAYGLYIEDQNQANTDYAIYTNQGKVRLGDTLSLAGTVPSITTEANKSLSLVPNGTGYTIIGDAGTSSHNFNTNDDLFVSGRLETKGLTYFENTVRIGGGSLCVNATDAPCSGSTAGTIYAANTTLQAADVAENYISSQHLEPGDIVMPEGRNNSQAIVTTTLPYQSQVIGVVSTKPGITLNSDASPDQQHPNIYPIALSGRIPVKVSTKNGTIQPGDLLTTSDIPGVAMKATANGTTIGKALEAYSGKNVGKIMVFVALSTALATASTTALPNTLSTAPTLDAIASMQQQIASLSAKFVQLPEFDSLLARVSALEFKEASGSADLRPPISGSGVISKGQTMTTIQQSDVVPDSKIFITPTTVTQFPLAVSALDSGTSFTVEIAQPATTDIHFNWRVDQ